MLGDGLDKPISPQMTWIGWSHNPEVAGSNPAPATAKGAGNGAFRFAREPHAPSSDTARGVYPATDWLSQSSKRVGAEGVVVELRGEVASVEVGRHRTGVVIGAENAPGELVEPELLGTG